MAEVNARRVLLLINSLALGGAETQLLGVARAVRDAGDDVVIVTLRCRNDFADRVAREGLEVWSPTGASEGWNVRQLPALMARIIRWKPDVTVSFLLQATLFARLTNLVARPARSVASMRNEKLETPLRRWIYRATCWSDDVIVVNSESARRTLQRSRTIPRDPRRVSVIYNGVDAAAMRTRSREDPSTVRELLGVGPRQAMVLGVGRLSSQKDWKTLIDAAALDERGSRYFVAGEGPLADDLTQHAHAKGISDRFTLLGLRGDVPDLLAAADCLALSSLHEGTPNVVLEALAMGTPVVATDVGACRELVTQEVGEVVPVQDATALAAALARQTVRTPTTAGTDLADRLFAWDEIGRQWRTVIHGARRSGGDPSRPL